MNMKKYSFIVLSIAALGALEIVYPLFCNIALGLLSGMALRGFADRTWPSESR